MTKEQYDDWLSKQPRPVRKIDNRPRPDCTVCRNTREIKVYGEQGMEVIPCGACKPKDERPPLSTKKQIVLI